MSRCNEHNYVLKPAKHPFYCQRCDQLGVGMCISCDKSSDCNLFYHEVCGNPNSLVKHPFSTTCVFKFYASGSGKRDLCDVCGKSIKGYHYRCGCFHPRRKAHPSCLVYERTLVACDGLTLNLQKVATEKCLICERRNLSYKIDGWAYVSSCGTYCYHVACVMDLINKNWQNAFMRGKSDPFEIVKERFSADKTKSDLIVVRNREVKRKRVKAGLKVIFHLMTNNHFGLVGDAVSIFGK